MTTNNFYAAMYQANLLYGTTFQDEDTFAEIGLVAHGMIGNKRTRLYKYRAKIKEADLSVDLPCNCDIIEAVTYDWEDWNYSDGVTTTGSIYSAHVEQYIEARKAFKDPLYIRGKYASYERVGDKLYFERPYGYVTILYKGQILDDDGLPMLNDKEVNAIAAFAAYVTKYKEGIQTNNANLINIANELKRQWLIMCDQARVPEEITQNEANDILDAKSSWNRKHYNKSLKPIM